MSRPKEQKGLYDLAQYASDPQLEYQDMSSLVFRESNEISVSTSPSGYEANCAQYVSESERDYLETKSVMHGQINESVASASYSYDEVYGAPFTSDGRANESYVAVCVTRRVCSNSPKL